MQLHGYHPLREALRHRPHRVERVLIGHRRGGARRREIEALCRRHGVPVEETLEKRLEELAPGVHNGFVAYLKPEAGERSQPEGDPHLVVLAEDIQDPRNLGALVRVCESAGVGRFLLRDRGSAPISPTVVKASAGASEWLPIERITNTANELELLKRASYWVYGAAAGGDPPWEADLTGPVVLCIGGEERGLRRRTRTLCDRLLGLPMCGRVESLNVATAAAALLYEALRQRLAAAASEPD